MTSTTAASVHHGLFARALVSASLLAATLALALGACTNGVGPAEGEGEGTIGEGEGSAGEGEGEGSVGEGEGEGHVGEGEGEGEGSVGEGEGEGGGSLVPGTTTRTFTIGSDARTAIQIVPNVASSQRVPLVIALHGNGDTAGNFVAALGLDALAQSDGFVLVAPQGEGRDIVVTSVNQDLGELDWDAYNDRPGNIDLLLLDDIVSELGASGSINASAIYVFGYSQGGFLSFRYGMDRSNSVAAVVAASSCSPLGNGLIDQAARTIPVALRIGANDGLVSGAQQSRDELQARGHEVQYEEIPGAGHVPFPGDVPPLFTWLLQHTL